MKPAQLENPGQMFAAILAVQIGLFDDGETFIEEWQASPIMAALRHAWPDYRSQLANPDHAALVERWIEYDDPGTFLPEEDRYAVVVPHQAPPYVATCGHRDDDAHCIHDVQGPGEEDELMVALLPYGGQARHQAASVAKLVAQQRRQRLSRRIRATPSIAMHQ